MSYLEHFKLRSQPFSEHALRESLWNDARMEEGLSRLQHLIFDEAHLLSGDALVDLRLLVSSAIELGPPLKILLVGQEHIRQTLKRSEYTDIVNRISVKYQLRPLTKDQTRQYIDYQVSHHGGDPKIFDEGVKDQIHEFTGGNPRGINNAAIACLLLLRLAPQTNRWKANLCVPKVQ